MPYDPMLGYTVMKGNNGPHGFHLNCAVAPLDNAEFRWALSYLVNYPKFAEVISAPPVLYNNGVFNSTDVHAKYRNKDILAKYPQEYNPEKAKEILEKLGYKAREDGKRLMPDGKPIFLEAYSYYSSGHQKTEFLLDLASEAGKVGIDVAVRMAQQPAAEAAVFVGNYSIYVRNVTGPGPSIDPFNLYNWLRKTDNPLGEKTSFNWNRWDNPKSDELLKELSAINPDDPKAMPLYDGLLEEFMKGMPSIPLVETAFARMWTKRYWDNIPTNDNYYAEPHTWGLRWHLVGPKLVPGPGFE